MTQVRLGANAVGIEHVADGADFTGVVSSDNDPNYNGDRGVLEHDPVTVDGEGLFDPHQYVDRDNPYCTFIQIISDGNWTIYVTSGLEDGTEDQVDAPANDQEIATGTGNVHYRMNIELLPQQKIRIVTTGNTITARAIVHFANTLNCGGRMIS